LLVFLLPYRIYGEIKLYIMVRNLKASTVCFTVSARRKVVYGLSNGAWS